MTQILIALIMVAPAVIAAHVVNWSGDAVYYALAAGVVGFIVVLALIQRFVPQGEALFPVLLGLLPLAGMAAGALTAIAFRRLRPAAGEGARAATAGALVAASTVAFYTLTGLI
ncbi:MAG: hypothetical protein AAF390_12270 [Pseudomonadota bacterium]